MLAALVDDIGGVDAVARRLGVHASTVRRWLRGSVQIPVASYRAMHAASSWGRQERYLLAVQERATLLALVEAQRREINALRADLARLGALSCGAANQAIYRVS
jgi:transposase-like protein